MQGAILHEIFASIQGEGPWVGERHIFIRFQGCDLHCRYCDTPASVLDSSRSNTVSFCSVQTGRGPTSMFEEVQNPVMPDLLSELCNRLLVPGNSRSTVSLTGGEPLLQRIFLAEWLPRVKQHYRVYLETNGIHADAMYVLRDLVDVICMDFKLPSATKLRPFWDEHDRFIQAAGGTALVVKAVITEDTSDEDIRTAARLIAGHDIAIPFILQPAGGALRPDSRMLVDFQELALGLIAEVRVIPQIHNMLNVR